MNAKPRGWRGGEDWGYNRLSGQVRERQYRIFSSSSGKGKQQYITRENNIHVRAAVLVRRAAWRAAGAACLSLVVDELLTLTEWCPESGGGRAVARR